MKPAILTLSLLCGLLAVQASAQDATATGGGVHCAPIDAPTMPTGVRVYTADGSDLSDAGEYPRLAKASSVEGQAAVDCQISSDGYMERCFVAQESQPGYDLGKALAITVLKWAQTDTARDQHHEGDWLRFTTNWKLPREQLAAGTR